MKRYEIIQKLIDKNKYKSYLEIGVLGNETFNSLRNLDIKDSVDPNGQAKYTMTSDVFFNENHCQNKYDIVFIDGLHLSEQVLRDIKNSLNVLNDGGIIVIHDCLPNYEWEQWREGISGRPWTGDVWKSMVELRYNDDLDICVVDTDCGCGLIKKQKNTNSLNIRKPDKEMDWNFYLENRKTLLNVISVEDFITKFIGR
jgi:hypothetical protein